MFFRRSASRFFEQNLNKATFSSYRHFSNSKATSSYLLSSAFFLGSALCLGAGAFEYSKSQQPLFSPSALLCEDSFDSFGLPVSTSNLSSQAPSTLSFLFSSESGYEEQPVPVREHHFVHETLRLKDKGVIRNLRWFFAKDKSHVLCFFEFDNSRVSDNNTNYNRFSSPDALNKTVFLHASVLGAIVDNTLGFVAYLNLRRPVTRWLSLSPVDLKIKNSDERNLYVFSCKLTSKTQDNKGRDEVMLDSEIFNYGLHATPNLISRAQANFVDVSQQTWGSGKNSKPEEGSKNQFGVK